MNVVIDTSPLRYLALIGQTELLPRLYGKVGCPVMVRLEASHPSAPSALRNLILQTPPWLEFLPPLTDLDPTLAAELDAGEAEAIEAAMRMRAAVLLMDERAGRRLAEERGLRVAGTLNILADAAARGWLDYHETATVLRKTTNFRASDEVVEMAYARSLGR
jgi:predicted nucleic acid-binding protein